MVDGRRRCSCGDPWLCGVHGKEAFPKLERGRVVRELHTSEQRIDVGRDDEAAVDLAEHGKPFIRGVDVDGVLEEGWLCRCCNLYICVWTMV